MHDLVGDRVHSHASRQSESYRASDGPIVRRSGEKRVVHQLFWKPHPGNHLVQTPRVPRSMVANRLGQMIIV